MKLSKSAKKQLWTIPNILSIIRMLLIPFVLIYYLQGEYIIAGILLITSAFSDMLDGYIARRFNLITDVGKVLDPLADKLTQFCVAIGLCISYKVLIPLVVVLTIKEMFLGHIAVILYNKGCLPLGARWWGKISTAIFYLAAIIIMFWGDNMPFWLITAMSVIVIGFLLYSMYRYYQIFSQNLN